MTQQVEALMDAIIADHNAYWHPGRLCAENPTVGVWTGSAANGSRGCSASTARSGLSRPRSRSPDASQLRTEGDPHVHHPDDHRPHHGVDPHGSA